MTEYNIVAGIWVLWAGALWIFAAPMAGIALIVLMSITLEARAQIPSWEKLL